MRPPHVNTLSCKRVSHATDVRVSRHTVLKSQLACLLSAGQEAVHGGARLRAMEHRQQRISELRAKYQCLREELEQTKQHLMLEPHKWTAECKMAADTPCLPACACVCVTVIVELVEPP